MSVKSQESNMRRLSALLSHDLSYAYGNSECGPNGSKKWSYLHLLDTLSALRKDRADNERAA